MTYDEMDRNQSQFFFSSSLHSSGTKLRLHFTGSDSLDTATEDYGPTRYQEIQLPSQDIEIPEAIAAGNHTEIQFNYSGSFGADSLFTFNPDKNYLGIGRAIPAARIHVAADNNYGALLQLDGLADVDNGTSHAASLIFRENETPIGRLGRNVSNDYDLYLTNIYPYPLDPTGAARTQTYGKIHISIGDGGSANDDEVVIGTFTEASGAPRFGLGSKIPNRVGTFVGSKGIGISRTGDFDLDQSYIAPIPSSIYNSTNADGKHDLIPNESNSNGLLISSPNSANGGNIVLAINTDTSTKNEGFNIINSFSGTYDTSSIVASFQATGKVGINTNFPGDVGLTVAGNISGSGTLQIETLNDDATSYTDLTAIGATSTGLVKKIAAVAAPVPVGGIVIWSGASNAIPQGWALCDGSTANGQVTPNLVNRFVVGATDSYSVGASGGSADAVVVSHTHTATVTDPGHTHSFTQENTRGTGASGAQNGESSFSTVNTNSSTTGISVSNSTTGESGTNKNLPPYYALCYIMYVGYSV